ncbi:MAG TPA: GEVED domain-containing protein, partial [Chitinophagales bacterium]
SIATNLSFQWQSNTDNAGWVSVGASDTVYSDLNGLVAGDLGSNAQYRLIITCTVSNESDTSNVATFTSGYCIPNGTDGGSYIDNFTTTGGITNVDNSSDYSNAGYGNYTTDTITQVVSSPINFSIDITGPTVGVAIWGDWNHDGTFDDSEQVYVTDGYDYGPFTGSFSIPAGATIGATQLRVFIDYNNSSPDDPCSFAYGRGEIEDYTIVVQAAEVPAPTISSFTPANGCANASTVVITGTNFTNATAVTIGGTAASSFTVNSSTQITANVGSGTSGVISVTTASGTATTTTVFTVNSPATTTQSFTLCSGETVTVGSHTYSAAGTYHDTLQTTVGGCDSIVITTLNSNNVNTSVSVVGVTATVATSNATYQWINCTSGQAVAGATAQSFTAAVSDNYKVAVTLSGCSDTSDCVNLVADTATGIKDVDWAKAISIYPNPTSGVATIAITNFDASDLIITITDIQGQVVFQSEENVHSSNFSTTINLNNAAKGVYLVKLNTGNSFAVKQLVLQ